MTRSLPVLTSANAESGGAIRSAIKEIRSKRRADGKVVLAKGRIKIILLFVSKALDGNAIRTVTTGTGEREMTLAAPMISLATHVVSGIKKN